MIRGLRKYGLKPWQLISLMTFLLVGILSEFLAHDKYLICLDSGVSFFVSCEYCNRGIAPPIPYRYNSIDKNNRGVSPLGKQQVASVYYRHWLGTDKLGRDVLAGVIEGAQVAVGIGFFSMLLSVIIGLLFGYLSGFLGDDSIRISWLGFLLLISCTCLFLFYFSYMVSPIRWLLLLSLMPLWLIGVTFFSTVETNKLGITIPLDIMVMRLIELFRSMPIIFIILVLLVLIAKPGYWSVIIIIAIVRWPTVTRYIRAEILKIKEQNFIQAAKMIGLSNRKIFIEQVLPMAISPVLVVCAFGFSSAILTESTLSFLGIGLPVEQVSWGSLLSQSRSDINSWWLVLFPGLMIYFSIYLFNTIGDTASEYLRGEVES